MPAPREGCRPPASQRCISNEALRRGEHPVTPLNVMAVIAAGAAAGAINSLVGSGTLITFPTLLAVGLPPITANVSNTVGLWPGSVAGAWAYRQELAGQRRALGILSVVAAVGAISGGLLLLRLPEDTFRLVVPILIVLSCVLVVAQPRITAALSRRGYEPEGHLGPVLVTGIFATGVYGGFFGAGQGVILIALLGILLDSDLQRAGAAKNVLAGVANVVAAAFFVVFAHIDWIAALLLSVGSVVGGTLGGRYGRRLPASWLRALVVVIGLTAVVKLIADR